MGVDDLLINGQSYLCLSTVLRVRIAETVYTSKERVHYPYSLSA
jgi:hypothetical protein